MSLSNQVAIVCFGLLTFHGAEFNMLAILVIVSSALISSKKQIILK